MKRYFLLPCAAVALMTTACVGRVPDGEGEGEGGGEGEGELGPFLDVDAPVRRSPDGRVVAVGQPPTALLIDLATGAASTTTPPEWIEAYQDEDTDEVVVWRVGDDDVQPLGLALAMQQDAERVWLQRGLRGPFVTVDKATLTETVVADAGRDLDVQPTYATLVIDGVLTVVSPRLIPIDDADAVESGRTVVGDRVLFAGSRNNLVDLATGIVIALSADGVGFARLLANGQAVVADRAAIAAVDLDGTRRTLCANNTFWFEASDSAVMCIVSTFVANSLGTATLVDVRTSAVIDAEPSSRGWLSPEGAYAFSDNEGSRLVFAPGHELEAPAAGLIDFNRDKTAARLFKGGVFMLANRTTSMAIEQRQTHLFANYAVVLQRSDHHLVVRLDTLQVIPRGRVLQSLEVPTTGTLLTVELDDGAVRPVLRAWVPPADTPVELLANVDRVVFAEQHTAVVVVDEPGNGAGENGTWVVPLP